MPKKISDSERELFRKAMAEVKPLKPSNKLLPTASKKPVPLQHKMPAPSRSSAETMSTRALSDHILKEVGPEEYLSFSQTGVQPRYFKRLRQGLLPIEAELDLHHLTIDEARERLNLFIVESFARKHRVIRIIHGKGSRSNTRIPLLKNLVNAWLTQYPEVLAFCSAQPRDGGTGALYVLLKRGL